MWGIPTADLNIEEGETADSGQCRDCDARALAAWGYVSKNGNAHAAYYAGWTEKHPERGIHILLSLGKWGEGSNSSMRKMVGVECRMGAGRPTFMVVDASKIKLDDDNIFGKGLTRDEALSDPAKDEFFRILDQITFKDSRIKKFLQSK